MPSTTTSILDISTTDDTVDRWGSKCVYYYIKVMRIYLQAIMNVERYTSWYIEILCLDVLSQKRTA